MNTRHFLVSSALATALAVALAPPAAQTAAMTVQTETTANHASTDESGATIASSALVEVLVTDANGVPVSNLGATVGSGTSAVTLPAGWDLQTPAVPPGGCLFTPTQFINSANGRYSIRLVPFVSNPACHWLAGDYVYSVQIRTSTHNGGALGKLTIR